MISGIDHCVISQHAVYIVSNFKVNAVNNDHNYTVNVIDNNYILRTVVHLLEWVEGEPTNSNTNINSCLKLIFLQLHTQYIREMEQKSFQSPIMAAM